MKVATCLNPLQRITIRIADRANAPVELKIIKEENVIRVGVVGFGLAGRIFHAAILSAVPGFELAAIVQRTGSSAAEVYPQARVVQSVDELLSDSSIRLVVIATPNQTHFPIAQQCLLAGRDVVIDKPAATTSQEVLMLTRLAESQGRMLTIYQNRRWDGDFLTVRKVIDSQRLGDLVRYESQFDRFRSVPRTGVWREDGGPGSGLLLDLGSHIVDQALVLFGLPAAIWADVRTERPGARSDDAFDLYMKYPARPISVNADENRRLALTVRLGATLLARSPGPRFTLHGTQGTYRKFGVDPQEDALRSGDLFHSKPWGADPREQWGTLTVDVDGTARSEAIETELGDYRGFYANVRDVLLGKAHLEVTPQQAWRTMRVLEMAFESSEKRAEVRCDWT
jgi:scyllo-inositol 2-dehydrogenase (NADP+)